MSLYNNAFGSICEAIGNTPLVEIRKLNPSPHVKIFAKLEGANPGGSIKDRVALAMIEGAESRGELTKDKIILEATSGNTGIGLAMIAAAKGYRIRLAMSEAASEERKRILRALGAELHFTPSSLGTDGAIEYVYNLLREHPETFFGPDQYNNPDNVLAHYRGTGEEIWQQTGGAVTMVVVALGTTGTAMGVSRRLKERNPAIRIVGVEPYLQHGIQGLKNLKESYVPGIFDRRALDEKVHIQDEDAFAMARRLAREEGILVGMSAGAAMHIALEKARDMHAGVIVVIFPDSGERYLSTNLFADETQTGLSLFNALPRGKVPFRPLDPAEIRIHSCGPTVHEVPHLGSYRRFITSDLLVRYLAYKGYAVRHVMGIIDLADRSIRGAEAADMPLDAYTQRNSEAFLRDLERLRIRKDAVYPRASEHVESMLRLVERLVDGGFAYEKLRSVYFDVSKLDDYGRLASIDPGSRKPGATVDLDEYAKDSPADFTLLKRASLSELKRGVYVRTRWGSVRPSWHLECAAIAREYLGDAFDIHCAGTDILFPHCENVMAIGRAATGKMPAAYWVNTELVMVEGKKMSRSLDNALTLDEVAGRGYGGAEIRFFLLAVHYRKPLHFSWAALDTAKYAVRRLNGLIQRLYRCPPGPGSPDLDEDIYDLKQGFGEAMDDDLGISGALARLFRFVRKVSGSLAAGRLSWTDRDRVVDVLRRVDEVLAVMHFGEEAISDEALDLIRQREALRARRRWGEADALRQRLAEMGIAVADTPEGPLWRIGEGIRSDKKA